MTKNSENATNGSNDSQTNDVTVVGSAGLGAVRDTPTEDVRESASAPVEGYKLTKLKDDEVLAVTAGLVELEVVAEGVFESSTGEVLRTGDRKTVSNVDAPALLDAKVNGKPAFKQV